MDFHLAPKMDNYIVHPFSHFCLTLHSLTLYQTIICHFWTVTTIFFFPFWAIGIRSHGAFHCLRQVSNVDVDVVVVTLSERGLTGCCSQFNFHFKTLTSILHWTPMLSTSYTFFAMLRLCIDLFSLAGTLLYILWIYLTEFITVNSKQEM